MSKADKKEREIFNKAIEIETPEERAAYIKSACEEDSNLIERIRSLLSAHDEAEFLPPHPGNEEITLPQSTLSEGPGTVIGRYKLLEKIGEGGMAVVYMAEQQKPIRRKVALKIIKLGMDTKQVIARFEAERQALAMMEHPNIAKVLDAGATETGRPYFVMELVTGVSITEYCDKNNLSTKERLALFIHVCNAVQHAHQKGIIHRDIKPTNIMITQHEGKPVPKVIDFGIAKATNQRLTEKTLFTRYAHIIGTPAYMSPEQADLGDIDVDTRSDIYSLGVLLYELLTGTTPFSEEQLRKAGYIEMQRIIQEKEPVKPSTKLSTLGQTLTDIAKHHGCTPDLLTKSIRGDLDWIVMKSLEKDRTRRYETANGLATDIQRHIEHEPVLARPPKTIYLFQKFLRRHRSQAVTSLIIMVLIACIVVILSQLNHNQSFRDENILFQARESYVRGDNQKALEYLEQILDSRYSGSEAQLLYASILVDDGLRNDAMVILENLLDARPEIAGSAHALMARILWESGSPNSEQLTEIDEHRQKAEDLLPETAEAYFLRAMTVITIKEKFELLNKALSVEPRHYESLRLRAFTHFASRQYEDAEHDALDMTRKLPLDPLGYSLRARSLRELGRYKEAIEEYKRAIELRPEQNAQRYKLYEELCSVHLKLGEYEKAVSQAREFLNLFPNEIILRFRIFCALTAQGNYEEADTIFYQIIGFGNEARVQFRNWCAKYVFDTLAANQRWHPVDKEPKGAAFLPMLEAEETYQHLSAKAERLICDGFTCRWSPDGTKLAFSAGVQGYSGVAVYDTATKQTELLIVPGKDPRWSPDGQYIAFVRDCQFLQVPEFVVAERENQPRLIADEEIWIINSEGTESRRLARGGWPCWSGDSKKIYYHSHLDNMLCSISIEGTYFEPKQIMACMNRCPTISPDTKRVAYLEGTSLKVKDLVSQDVIIEFPVLFETWGGPEWSSTGHELCLGGRGRSDDEIGLWIFNLNAAEPVRILGGRIVSGSWSSTGLKLAFQLGPPYFEFWAVDLDPNISTIEKLGPGQTLEEYYSEMIEVYTRRIEYDPNDAYSYSSRAQYFDYLNEQENANADMQQWSNILCQNWSSNLKFGKLENLGLAINTEAAEGQPLPSIDGLYLLFHRRNAEGNFDYWWASRETMDELWKTVEKFSFLRSEALLSGITTEDGLELYFHSSGEYGNSDIFVRKRQTIYDDWGDPINLGPVVNSSAYEMSPAISPDGLELYFSDFYTALRPDGCGAQDLWVTRRTTRDDPWSEPVNLGLTVNSTDADGRPSLSTDGLVLLFDSTRPGGMGRADLYMTMRATINAPWEEPVNLGPSVNTPDAEYYPHLSADGSTLYWDSDRLGGHGDYDIWQVPITPSWKSSNDLKLFFNDELIQNKIK